MQPKRAILSIQDMPKWKKSAAYTEYLDFVRMLNDAAKDSKLTDQIEKSSNIEQLSKLLNKLSVWIDEIPPIQQPQRFGNKAFRTWFGKVKENSQSLIKETMPDEKFSSYVEEVACYLTESFGNDTRIDYGSGHEMAFGMFLMCLFKIEFLKAEDAKAAVVCIFNEYLNLARKLQTTYNMEPAGSHGVWSLDDFQFLPFIFGSSQLQMQMQIEPRHFVEDEYIERYKEENMFFSCIKFITTVKQGMFAEHSNQLWNISSLPTWNKVNSGLIKMYQGEVLDKFPVVQHILFGNLIKIEPL